MADTVALRATLESIHEIPIKRLVSRTSWGEIDFSKATQDLESIYEIATILRDLPLERLPQEAAHQIDQALKNCLNWIKKNDAFSLSTEGNPSSTRDTIVQHIAQVQQELYKNAHQWIPFLAYLKGDIPKQLEVIVSSVDKAKDHIGGLEDFLADKKKEVDDIVQATREASAEAGVGHFTEDFAKDAVEREQDAKQWLRASVVAASATAIASIVFFFVKLPEGTAGIVQMTTSKLVLLGLLIAITTWCAGNYKANKHQSTVSRHKAHSLKTFRAFVSATDDESVKDAVLLETTRAIFSHSSSGYVASESHSDQTSKIFEIFKSSTDRSA